MKGVLSSLIAYQVLDSRGVPTIAVRACSGKTCVTEYVPSGASKGKHEALELRDGGHEYFGKGVSKAIENINTFIAKKLLKKELDPKKLDKILLKLDPSLNKFRLGGNAITAVSLACWKLSAKKEGIQLHEKFSKKPQIPQPYLNILNGGKHADNKISIQEFMIVPAHKTLTEKMRISSEIYQTLKAQLKSKGKFTGVGDEGGFAPRLKNTQEALDLISKSIDKSGFAGSCSIALDCAASEFLLNSQYLIDDKKMNSEKLGTFYHKLIEDYNITSIEDPFDQDDFGAFKEFTAQSKINVVGDDLLVTNPTRIKMAVEKKLCNSLLLKVNQVGTVSEALEAHKLALKNKWSTMVSHRSGETNSTFIADLAVGLNASIKAGAPCRGERVAKYNRLLEIENSLK